MTRKTVDEHTRDHYAEVKLPGEARARLRATAELQSRSRSFPGIERPVVFRLAAAVAVAALGLSWFASGGFGASTSQSVADEIALNHVKRLAVDYRSDDPSVLTKEMERLDFQPVWGPRLASLDAKLVGARYCSLGGQIAAQVVLEGPAGERFTLYETRDSEALASIAPGHYSARGVEIELWRHAGVLFGLASPAELQKR